MRDRSVALAKEGVLMFSSYYMDRHGRVYSNKMNPEDRRVAVVDFEDREQVERLLRAWCECTYSSQALLDKIPRMQAALREFAEPTPPRPEEPTGLGAVVEDAEGVRWVRKGDERCGCPWSRQIGAAFSGQDWDRIDAVRVLSEGVIA